MVSNAPNPKDMDSLKESLDQALELCSGLAEQASRAACAHFVTASLIRAHMTRSSATMTSTSPPTMMSGRWRHSTMRRLSTSKSAIRDWITIGQSQSSDDSQPARSKSTNPERTTRKSPAEDAHSRTYDTIAAL